jgi:undecaprenyl-diphosphatase
MEPLAAPSRSDEGGTAALAAVALGGIGSFLVLSRTITGRSRRFDRAVVRAVGRARRPITNALMRGVTFFGGAIGAVGVSAAALVLARNQPRLAGQIAAGALGGVTAELVLKRIFLRKRPTMLLHLEQVASTSFPSGHSMAAASLYLTLAFVASRTRRLRGHRRTLLAAAGALAASVAGTRVYLGVHWPTDVLGGLALGTAWACGAEAAFDR